MAHRISVLDRAASGLLRPQQPLLSKQLSSSSSSSSSSPPVTTSGGSSTCVTCSKSSRIAEVAGGTAAECAAVCCCCPCATIDLLVLVIVKFPAGLCRRALRKKGRHRRAKLVQSKLSEEEEETWVQTCVTAGTWPEKSPSRVVSEMELEMWDTFCNSGFGRSPSQRQQ